MSSFQVLGFFRFHNNPEAEAQQSFAHAVLNVKTERESMRVISLPQGYCERKSPKS